MRTIVFLSVCYGYAAAKFRLAPVRAGDLSTLDALVQVMNQRAMEVESHLRSQNYISTGNRGARKRPKLE